MDIAVYVFCVMYSPGPVNLLAFNGGLQGSVWPLVGYCVGVGLAMFCVFIVLGYLGGAVVHNTLMPYVSVVGSAYILYLAYTLFRAPSDSPNMDDHYRYTDGQLRFSQGYLLQLLNPKGLVVVLPVTAVMFPASNISGVGIVACAGLISLGAIGAPLSYASLGAIAGRRITQPFTINVFNKTMAALLVLVAGSIIYDLSVHWFAGSP